MPQRRLITADELAGAPARGVSLRSAGVADLAGSNGRVVRYVFSDASVGRDDHTIAADAWVLTNFLKNPVFLWAHQTGEPPIGRVLEIGDVRGRLMGSVEYAERDVYPFADTVYQLVRGGFINATSTQWDPIEWTRSTDKARPKGIDFIKVDLLEVSQVPVPALPTALAAARRVGIDTGPIVAWAEKILDSGDHILIPRAELEALRREARMPTTTRTKRTDYSAWKDGVSRTLPLRASDDPAWDAAAAAERIFKLCGFDGKTPDVKKARKAFLLHDPARPKDRDAYALPIADVVEGRLVAIGAALREAADNIPDSLGAEPAERAKEAIELYSAIALPARAAPLKRGLWQVSWLAAMLNDLGYLADDVAWEAHYEQDGSTVPAQLLDAVKLLGEALIAMTAEEVAELVDATEKERAAARSAGAIELDGSTNVHRTAQILVHALEVPAVNTLIPLLRAHLAGHRITFTDDGAPGALRAGKVVSAATGKTLRDAHGYITRGCDMVREIFDLADNPDDENQDDQNTDETDLTDESDTTDDGEQERARAAAVRARKAKLMLEAAAAE